MQHTQLTDYCDRLAFIMTRRGLDPRRGQTALARLVGPPCKPQNINVLLNPAKGIKYSRQYNADIARVLRCDPEWLATGRGWPAVDIQPPISDQQPAAINVQEPSAAYNVTTETTPSPQPANESFCPPWPFSVSWKRIMRLPPDVLGRIDGYIESRVEEWERMKMLKTIDRP